MYEQLKSDLCIGIARSRGGRKAGKLAKQLLQADGLSELLVGLTSRGVALVYTRSIWPTKQVTLPGDG